MLDMLRPVHDTLHNVIDPFCGDPSFLGMCPEFWAGMLVAAVIAKYGGNKNIQDFLIVPTFCTQVLIVSRQPFFVTTSLKRL